jgi:hypothetical protein
MSVDECGSDGLTWVPRYGSNHHEALQLWPSEPYAIRGHFIRFVGNVRNVVLCNVTTEKRSVPGRHFEPLQKGVVLLHSLLLITIVFHTQD